MLYFSFSPIFIPQGNLCLLTSFFLSSKTSGKAAGHAVMPGVSEGISSFINYFFALPLLYVKNSLVEYVEVASASVKTCLWDPLNCQVTSRKLKGSYSNNCKTIFLPERAHHDAI